MKDKFNSVLYPSVLVRTKKAGGSGTVIYSKPEKKGATDCETYVLTNFHVVEDAIYIRKEWSPLLNKEIKKETRGTVTVEFYKYKNKSVSIGKYSVEASIEAYDKEQDMALLKLKDVEKQKYVAKLFSEDIKTVNIFDNCYICGCGLGHPPFQTKGEICGLVNEIDNYNYFMTNAGSIFGNSGGGVYLESSGEFIGIPSRVAIAMVGFGLDAITHMGYFIPVDRIYKWIKEVNYQFIYDSKYTSEQCSKIRTRKQKNAQKIWDRKESEDFEEEETPKHKLEFDEDDD